MAATEGAKKGSDAPKARRPVPKPFVYKPRKRPGKYLTPMMHLLSVTAALATAVFVSFFGVDFVHTALGLPRAVRSGVAHTDLEQTGNDDGFGPLAAETAFLATRRYDTPVVQNFSELGHACPGRTDTKDSFTRCIPQPKRCSRALFDLDISTAPSSATFPLPDELPPCVNDTDNATTLSPRGCVVQMMERVLRIHGRGGGSGPVSLVELHKGIVSLGDKFASLPLTVVHAIRENPGGQLGVSLAEMEVMWNVLKNIERRVSEYLFCSALPCATPEEAKAAQQKGAQLLYLSPPSFFSRITGTRPAKSMNDEYWHLHIDRNQYGSFAVTTLLYLDDYVGALLAADEDDRRPPTDAAGPADTKTEGPVEPANASGSDGFTGGTFEFRGVLPTSVRPRAGRLLMFTSSEENPHFVSRVGHGVRRALTTAFTCNAESGIPLGRSFAKSPLYEVLRQAVSYNHAEFTEKFTPVSEVDEDSAEEAYAKYEDAAAKRRAPPPKQEAPTPPPDESEIVVEAVEDEDEDEDLESDEL